MSATAQIVEMDQERDRKTCVALDLKVSGANRELAQWLLDHPKYSKRMVAAWLGCGPTRIQGLRKWAASGFNGSPFDSNNKFDNRGRHDVVAPSDRSPLKTNNNSESDDNFDGDRDDVAEPEVLEDNILYAINGVNENARIFNKLLRISALDREAADRIITAIDRMIGKWRSIQSTLEKKG